MYNSFAKYYLKKWIGPKNDMWYFDNWTREYFKYNKIYLKNLNSMMGKDIENQIDDDHSVHGMIMRMREKVLVEYKDKFSNNFFQVAIHIPPVNVSPAANSWMINLEVAFRYAGISTYCFWDQVDQERLYSSNILIGIGADFIGKFLDQDLIHNYRSKYKGQFWLQASVNYHSEQQLDEYIDFYAKKGVDGFYSFDRDDFNIKFGLKDKFKTKGFQLCSFTFSANPLLHYPINTGLKKFKYIFLGSTNYDKIERYNAYFPRITKSSFPGIISGPGWGWSDPFHHNASRDRSLYAQSLVGLNLHLKDQIEFTGQLNERSYILAAVGLPQVLDTVHDLKSYFPKIGLSSSNSDEYLNNLLLLVSKPELRLSLAEKAAAELYTSHTTFHRINQFLLDTGLLQ